MGITFRGRMFLGVLVLAGMVSLGLTWVLHELLTGMLLQVVSTATSAAAVQMSRQLEPESVGKASRGDVDERAALRGKLAEMREGIFREFPPWWLGDPGQCMKRVMVVAPAGKDGGAVVVVSTDGLSEGEGYEFGPAPIPDVDWEKWKWQAMTGTEEFLTTPRGVVLAGRSPIRDASGVPVGVVVIESDEAFVAASRGPLLSFVQSVFACAMLGAAGIAFVLAGRTGRPVMLLAGGMERLAKGELGTTIEPPARGDEFDALVERFNVMSKGLLERETMRRSLADASEVQRQLLPAALPEIEGYEALHAVHYCEQTGGDYVDVLPVTLGDGRRGWGLALGDVAGHGIAAAMLMSWTRAMIRVLSSVHGGDVSGTARVINAHLRRDIADGTFLTLFLGVLDPSRHRMGWMSAGNDPALVVRAGTGAVEELWCTDAPLGVLDDVEFAAGAEVEMGAGDLLFMASDGLTQTRDGAGRHFGMERVKGILAGLMGRPLEEIRDAVVRAAKAHRGAGAQDDDITMLMVRRG